MSRASDSLRMVAARLGRAPSTVSRELARNGGRSSIGLIVPTGLPYVGADVLNHRNWRPIINFGWWWRRNSRSGGHRNRSSSG